MARAQKDYYQSLGVPRNAGPEEIRRAFRKRAMEYHPDRNKSPGAEAHFKEINEAYEVLSDPEKRQMYDRFGTVSGSPFERAFEGFGFGGLGDIFDAFFGGTSTRVRRGPQRGADLHYNLTITFEEAVFGAEREIEVTRAESCSSCGGSGATPGSQPVRCPTCNGSGEVRRVQQSIFGQFVNVATCERCQGEGRIVTDPCKRCRGTGRERKTRRLVVKIPAGVDTRAQLRLSGEGEVGSHGGAAGNLYVTLTVLPHPLFRREGDDLVLDHEINVAQAALGAQVSVPTLEGEEPLSIPPGTQSGEIFVLRGKGVPHLRQGGRGDLLVHVTVAVPRDLTDEQRRLLAQLAESLGTPVGDQDRGLFERLKDSFQH